MQQREANELLEELDSKPAKSADSYSPTCTCGPKFNRWTVLSVGLVVESIGGLFYMFAVYSQDLKTAHWEGGDGQWRPVDLPQDFIPTLTTVL